MKMLALLEKLETVDSEQLTEIIDGMIIDAKEREASEINNCGLDIQLTYLVQSTPHSAESLFDFLIQVFPEMEDTCELCGRPAEEASEDGCKCDFHKPEDPIAT